LGGGKHPQEKKEADENSSSLNQRGRACFDDTSLDQGTGSDGKPTPLSIFTKTEMKERTGSIEDARKGPTGRGKK